MAGTDQRKMLYMPILKARQGEQIALRNVPTQQMVQMLPVVELLPLPTQSTKTATELRRLYLEKTATWMTKAHFTNHRVAVDTAAHFDPTQSACGTLISVCIRTCLNAAIKIWAYLHCLAVKTSR
jgi:hypothetical protein